MRFNHTSLIALALSIFVMFANVSINNKPLKHPLKRLLAESHFYIDTEWTNFQMAKLMSNLGLYDDSLYYMKQVVKDSGALLNKQERDFLIDVESNMVSAQLKSLDENLLEIGEFEKQGKDISNLKSERMNILQKLESECQELISALDDNLIPNVIDNYTHLFFEDSVFYLKMKADYYEQLAQVYSGDYGDEDKMNRFRSEANDAYDRACIRAKNHLDVFNDVRLLLYFRFAVFIYEFDSKERAVDSAESSLKLTCPDLKIEKSEIENMIKEVILSLDENLMKSRDYMLMDFIKSFKESDQCRKENDAYKSRQNDTTNSFDKDTQKQLNKLANT